MKIQSLQQSKVELLHRNQRQFIKQLSTNSLGPWQDRHKIKVSWLNQLIQSL